MEGHKFGRLTVVHFSHRDKNSRKFYSCQCDCGGNKVVQASLLRFGNTKSCGCLAKEPRLWVTLPNQGGVVNHIILQYKRHAKDREIEWRLDRDDVDRLVREPCHYCGIIGGNLKKTKNCKDGFRHNGIDRIDSSRSYEADNVVPCCGSCNRAKGAMTRDEFVTLARRIATHQDAMADQWSLAIPSQTRGTEA